MLDIIKICAFGIIGVLLALQFKGQKPEYGVYIGLALSLLLVGCATWKMERILQMVESLRIFMGSSGTYIGILLKVIGITYICEFASGICKDAGYGGVADQIEIFGKLTVMLCGMPILFAVIEQIQGLMKT